MMHYSGFLLEETETSDSLLDRKSSPSRREAEALKHAVLMMQQDVHEAYEKRSKKEKESPAVSSYEEQRRANMAENKRKLEELGL